VRAVVVDGREVDRSNRGRGRGDLVARVDDTRPSQNAAGEKGAGSAASVLGVPVPSAGRKYIVAVVVPLTLTLVSTASLGAEVVCSYQALTTPVVNGRVRRAPSREVTTRALPPPPLPLP
jgi:hypothetical protein